MYTPTKKILKNYAEVLVNFALGKGRGISRGDIVYLQFDSPALPLAYAVYEAILCSGGHPMVKQNEEDFSKIFYNVASEDQLEFFPKRYMKSLVSTIDHRLYLIAHRDPFLLKNVDPALIMRANKKAKVMKKWLFEKEDRGRLTWTLALYGTAGQAREAGLSLKEFWEQIEIACFLRDARPKATWKRVFTRIEAIRGKLNKLGMRKLHITAHNTDLWINLGESRRWLGGRGANIPSFELFTSPDWRGTEGHIHFDYPLYTYGNLVKDVYLEFKSGRVVKAQARKNQKLLTQIISQKNADKVGEYSLTDKRFSHITRFMANTLYDENFGGEYGNTHLALGSSYHEAYAGEAKHMKSADWKRLGFNESAEHKDIISTTDRAVEATLSNGVKKIIYTKGEFVV